MKQQNYRELWMLMVLKLAVLNVTFPIIVCNLSVLYLRFSVYSSSHDQNLHAHYVPFTPYSISTNSCQVPICFPSFPYNEIYNAHTYILMLCCRIMIRGSAREDRALYAFPIYIHACSGNRGSACCGVDGPIHVSKRGCAHYRRMPGEVMRDVRS